MDDQRAAEACSYFINRLRVGEEAGMRAERKFIRALRALPEPDHFVTGFDGDDPAKPRVLGLVGDRLVEVWAFHDDDNECRTAQRSRLLVNAGVCVEMEWGPLDRFDWGTGHENPLGLQVPDGPDVDVSGTVQAASSDVPNSGEAFARQVAATVGWVVS
jgi:hypothetical protein